MVVRKVIIPVAGLGTRLYPATKVQPKEMLPIFSRNRTGDPLVKPMVQVVFEQLFDAGFREFCFVVGKGKRAIEDHFTPDNDCVKILEANGKNGQALDLYDFYEKLRSSTIMWVNQPEPKGFGNAVLMAQPFTENDKCLVHAGDAVLLSKQADHLRKLINVSEQFKADATFLVLEIKNARQYGIAEGQEVDKDIIRVQSIVEKPDMPKTNLAVMAMYTFKPVIFKALETILPGKNGEIQLTDAIQKLIDWGLNVYAVKLDEKYMRLDIGTPTAYWEAIGLSYNRQATDAHWSKNTI